MKEKICIILTIIFLLITTSAYAGDKNRGEYTYLDYIEYKLNLLIIKLDSKILAEKIYKRVIYWQTQPKPEPEEIKNHFYGRV